MVTVKNLSIRQQSGATGTYYASWLFSATTTSSMSSNSTSASNGVKTGDIVKITSGATYYNGVAIPSWVMAKEWYVVQVKGDRAVLGKSTDGANNIQSAINTKYLTGGTGGSSSGSNTGSTASASELEHYEVKWFYDTGDSIWFSGGETTTKDENAIYNPPSNAVRIKITVKPVSKTYTVNDKETPYWTGTEAKAEYNISGDIPEQLNAPSVEIDWFTLTATVDNVTSPTTDYVEFQVWDGDYLYDTNNNCKVQVRACRAVFTCTIAAGGNYRVRCRALNQIIGSTGATTSNGAVINGVSYKYGPWSDFSDGKGTIPLAPTGVKAVAASENSIKVTWYAVDGAKGYDIQYVTNKDYFDASSEVKTQSVESGTTAYLTGLEGDEWFIRVRAKNDSGVSSWSSIVSTVVGTVPEAPTTWSLTSSVVVGEDAILYWVHNTEDGSKMQGAQIELSIDDIIVKIINKGPDTNEDDEVSIQWHLIDTTEYGDGAAIRWQVRTQGITGEWGPWSTQRTIKVYAKPTIALSMTCLDDNNNLTMFPLTVNALAGPYEQYPVSFHVSVVAETSYETTDIVGEGLFVPAGTEIFSRVYNNIQQYMLDVVLYPGDIMLVNDQYYTITISVSMDSGLSASQSMTFGVDWGVTNLYPDASVVIDKDTLSAYITPICVGEDGTLASDVMLSVYRREFNGAFTLIMGDIPNDRVATLTDPHPALDYARYRIVAQDWFTGVVSYSDLPGIPVNEPSIVIQWNDRWDNFNYTNVTDRFETQPWNGSMLRLPYNVDVTEKTDMDVSLIEYIGRKSPVSYYGTQRGLSASWRTDIPKYDKDTLYALRRLSDWAGDVYVREPNGTGYWANIKVSWSINHLELIVPISIEVTRVEGGI